MRALPGLGQTCAACRESGLQTGVFDHRRSLVRRLCAAQVEILSARPPLSGERRTQLSASIKHMGEQAKIAIRNARRDANKILDTEQKGGVITEDEDARGKDEVTED